MRDRSDCFIRPREFPHRQPPYTVALRDTFLATEVIKAEKEMSVVVASSVPFSSSSSSWRCRDRSNGRTFPYPSSRFSPPRRMFPVEASQMQSSSVPDPFETKETYSDNDPISKFMIGYFSRVMSKQLDGHHYDGTYEGFVELSREIMRGRTSKEQQDTVAGVLSGLLPPQSPERFRKWFPLNRRNAEFNAWITTLGFGWLVGPSEVQEVEVEFKGKKEVWRSGVHIKKCRYLENSGCVGMCVNMCKIPTQKFFTDMFGLPLTMNPNFETLECDMIFGESPPPLEEDPVYNQPCLSPCKMGRQESDARSPSSFQTPCPKIDTERRIYPEEK